jgi:dynein heavy chain
MTLEPPSGLK